MEFEFEVGLEYFVDDERVRADAELRDKLSRMFERTDASIATDRSGIPRRSHRTCRIVHGGAVSGTMKFHHRQNGAAYRPKAVV